MERHAALQGVHRSDAPSPAPPAPVRAAPPPSRTRASIEIHPPGAAASSLPANRITLELNSLHKMRFRWQTMPSSVLLVGKLFEESVMRLAREMAAWLVERGVSVLVEPHVQPQLGGVCSTWALGSDALDELVDCAVCLGGDGSLLYLNSLFAGAVPPTLAFNLGSLGFLTAFNADDWERHLTALLDRDRDHILTLRRRLVASVYRGAECLQEATVLNEVVLDRGPSPYITDLECHCNDTYATTVRGDGLIVATSTGSTAYSLSAGGSMLHPLVPALIMTPICPHSLSFRPIVLPDSVSLKLRVAETSRGTAWISFDGRSRRELQPGDFVVISGSPCPFPTIAMEDDTREWFTSLGHCLNWNVRAAQAPLNGHAPKM